MIAELDYLRYDATGLAELVARREVSASELLETAITLAQRENPRLNGIVIPFFEQARARAREPLSGPFVGVPFLLKDLFQDYKGVASSWGNKARKHAPSPAPDHSEITRRWLAAGVVPFGFTNAPELGTKGLTEPEAWGATRNPWDLQRSSGGSSGGSSAMVAAGVVPMAGANDGAGSIRIPAAYTGLFGFKPGRGRTPFGPWLHVTMHGAGVNHVLTRSVRDSARMLDATHGPELGSPALLPPPERPYAEQALRDPEPLRIAYTTRSPFDYELEPEAIAAVENTVRLLESLGHRVESAEPALDGKKLATDFLTTWFVHIADSVEQIRQETHSGNAGFEIDTLAMAAVGRSIKATQYVERYNRWHAYRLELARLHSRYALYMTPTVAGVAPRLGSVRTPPAMAALAAGICKVGADRLLSLAKRLLLKVAMENLGHVPFTQIANLAGVPAMSVPLHITAQRLPIGVQFLGPAGSEGLLFSLAGQLERAAPWAQRYPFPQT